MAEMINMRIVVATMKPVLIMKRVMKDIHHYYGDHWTNLIDLASSAQLLGYLGSNMLSPK